MTLDHNQISLKITEPLFLHRLANTSVLSVTQGNQVEPPLFLPWRSFMEVKNGTKKNETKFFLLLKTRNLWCKEELVDGWKEAKERRDEGGFGSNRKAYRQRKERTWIFPVSILEEQKERWDLNRCCQEPNYIQPLYQRGWHFYQPRPSPTIPISVPRTKPDISSWYGAQIGIQKVNKMSLCVVCVLNCGNESQKRQMLLCHWKMLNWTGSNSPA